MAGKIFKVRLFQPFSWLRHLPDLRTIRMFVPHFWTRKKDCRDDSLMMAIVNEFAAEGIHFAPATDYAPELLVPRGPAHPPRPDAPGSRRTSSSAGGSPRRWAGSTSARAWR